MAGSSVDYDEYASNGNALAHFSTGATAVWPAIHNACIYSSIYTPTPTPLHSELFFNLYHDIILYSLAIIFLLLLLPVPSSTSSSSSAMGDVIVVAIELSSSSAGIAMAPIAAFSLPRLRRIRPKKNAKPRAADIAFLISAEVCAIGVGPQALSN